jgi:hypothetical protein
MERYTKSRDATVIPFRRPEAIDDPLSELAREGARRMRARVLIAEADSFVATCSTCRPSREMMIDFVRVHFECRSAMTHQPRPIYRRGYSSQAAIHFGE